jgi:hypothetical protein
VLALSATPYIETISRVPVVLAGMRSVRMPSGEGGECCKNVSRETIKSHTRRSAGGRMLSSHTRFGVKGIRQSFGGSIIAKIMGQ